MAEKISMGEVTAVAVDPLEKVEESMDKDTRDTSKDLEGLYWEEQVMAAEEALTWAESAAAVLALV